MSLLRQPLLAKPAFEGEKNRSIGVEKAGMQINLFQMGPFEDNWIMISSKIQLDLHSQFGVAIFRIFLTSISIGWVQPLVLVVYSSVFDYSRLLAKTLQLWLIIRFTLSLSLVILCMSLFKEFLSNYFVELRIRYFH